MEVKNEMTREINGGRSRLVVTPDMGKVMFRKSINNASWETGYRERERNERYYNDTSWVSQS